MSIHIKRKYLTNLVFILLFSLGYGTGFTQNSSTNIVNEIQQAYINLKYEEAKSRAETALVSVQNLSPTELTEIHKFLGLIYYSRKMTPEARNHFETALSITPQLALDPIYVSPKIIDFFKQVKTDVFAKQGSQGDVRTSRYVFVYDPRPSAGMRSMLLPGWGQFYKGEKRKGTVLSALWAVGVAGSVITHVIRQNARDTYLRETDPVKIQSRFNTFDTFHKLRNNFVIFSAGVWVFSYFDAILSLSPEHSNLGLSPQISTDAARLNFSISF